MAAQPVLTYVTRPDSDCYPGSSPRSPATRFKLRTSTSQTDSLSNFLFSSKFESTTVQAIDRQTASTTGSGRSVKQSWFWTVLGNEVFVEEGSKRDMRNEDLSRLHTRNCLCSVAVARLGMLTLSRKTPSCHWVYRRVRSPNCFICLLSSDW